MRENELITEDLLDKPEADSEKDATAEVAEAKSEENTSVDAADELPEKFRGKSAAEIAKSATEAERRMHEIASERSAVQRENELMRQQMQALQVNRTQSSETDPEEVLEKNWDNDPKDAVKRSFRLQREAEEKSRRKAAIDSRAREANEYSQRNQVENPDYAERVPTMNTIAQKYGHILNPEYAMSREVLEILDLASKGARVDVYEKRAEERALKQKEKIKEEKRAAQSERSGTSSTGSNDDDEDFMSMSRDQRNASLDKLRRSLMKKG